MIYFDRDDLLNKKEALEKEMTNPGFWEDNISARKTAKKLDKVKNNLSLLNDFETELEETELFLEMAKGDNDKEAYSEVKKNLKALEEKIEETELKFRLNGKYDHKNAILSIHPGAGGTESQDWAEMLLRMYTRWSEKKDYNVKTLDLLIGEEAGIKRATLLIEGDYCYGYLKGESGVHRLVRISPFDSSGRRHTSFASVDIMPELDDDIEVDIDDADLKIETYRASGAGGQHVNKTDSAVRITHLPTGTVVQCQNERSQHKNKKMAMKILKSRLLEMKEQAQAEKIDELRDNHKEIAWGSQIRSYVFHPYNLIKDHRTNVEEGNVQKVMDGDLDDFIEAFLKKAE